MFEKLKKRWAVESNLQFWTLFLVFAITGSTAAKITGPILKYFLNPESLGFWTYQLIYLVATLVLYQFLLVGFGWLFGEYHFFRNFIKKIVKRMGLSFLFGN
ncbi:MAG: DUF6787 family protein [Flavobacteriaceae bacterium]